MSKKLIEMNIVRKMILLIDHGLSERQIAHELKLSGLILMGPSGTGKTFISAGLCAEAVKKGYKAYFRSMDGLINTLKMKEVTRTAKAEYKRLLQAHLIVIDDIMLFLVEKKEAVSLFNFVNQIYEKTSFIGPVTIPL